MRENNSLRFVTVDGLYRFLAGLSPKSLYESFVMMPPLLGQSDDRLLPICWRRSVSFRARFKPRLAHRGNRNAKGFSEAGMGDPIE
jgi:hypothetical protein